MKQVSPSQKKPYWRLALDAATPHLTQFPNEIHQMTAMSDEQLNKFMEDPQHQWWTEPMTLIFGKAIVAGKPTDDPFANLNAVMAGGHEMEAHNPLACGDDWTVALGGPWFYYNAFRKEHGLGHMKVAEIPEIGIKAGMSLLVPLVIGHGKGKAGEIEIEVTAPAGWKVAHGAGKFTLVQEDRTDLNVEIATPELSKDELNKLGPQQVVVRVAAQGNAIGEVKLKVALRGSALAQ